MRACRREWYVPFEAIHVCGLDVNHDEPCRCRTCDRNRGETLPQNRVVEVRLCIETGAKVDPGNYAGPIHCLEHPEGYACTTALYSLRDSTITCQRDVS